MSQQDKEIVKKLFNVIARQQQIITKLAQNVGDPTSGHSLSNPSKDATAVFQKALSDLTKGRGGVSILSAHGPLTDGTTRVQMKFPATLPKEKSDQFVNLFKTKVSQIPGF